MYHTAQYIIDSRHPLFRELEGMAYAANNLHNTALFRLRQIFTGAGKTNLKSGQKEVMDEVITFLPVMNAARDAANRKKEARNEKIREQNEAIAGDNVLREKRGEPPKELIAEKKLSRRFEAPTATESFVSFTFLEGLLKASKNDCYLDPRLPRQTAQTIIKEAHGDFKNYFAALRAYRKTPQNFTGRPRMPKYRKKGGMRNVPFSNQDCVIRDGTLKFPGTKDRLTLGAAVPENAKLKYVEARPWYGRFQICVVWDDGIASPDPASESERIAAIDFGVDNLAAMANNIGMPGLLFKGGIVKSENQWFNKEKARITSELTRGKETKPYPRTHRLDSLSRHREGVMRTQMNTCARRLVEQCAEWDVDTIVLGVNLGWKQNSDMGTANNQKFVSVPHERLRMRIRQLAEAHGIRVVDQEESYTSKASFLHGDEMPVYGETDGRGVWFSGWRETRGMYRLKGEKKRVNADLNGAGNILRKAFPQRISPEDDRFLQEIVVI